MGQVRRPSGRREGSLWEEPRVQVRDSEPGPGASGRGWLDSGHFGVEAAGTVAAAGITLPASKELPGKRERLLGVARRWHSPYQAAVAPLGRDRADAAESPGAAAQAPWGADLEESRPWREDPKARTVVDKKKDGDGPCSGPALAGHSLQLAMPGHIIVPSLGVGKEARAARWPPQGHTAGWHFQPR